MDARRKESLELVTTLVTGHIRALVKAYNSGEKSYNYTPLINRVVDHLEVARLEGAKDFKDYILQDAEAFIPNISIRNGFAKWAGQQDQYKCPSYFDDNNVLQNCTCGKCK